jgi:flagellar motor protein MotB
MAAKGGGAWKVAYADFVTAMMAFFLVMWICSQDQKVKRAVADYFGHPLAVKQGSSKDPYRTGALFEGLTTGSVPREESVAVGMGRSSYSYGKEGSRITKQVSDWIFNDKEVSEHWKARADTLRRTVVETPGRTHKSEPASVLATKELANELKSQIGRDTTQGKKGLSEDLVQHALAQVNWMEIAEDLLFP